MKKMNTRLKNIVLYKMETKTVKELREIAKERGLRGYYKLHKAELIDAINKAHLLDAPVPNIQVPILEPTAYQPPKTTLSKVTSHIKSFADWLLSYVPEPIKRPINEKLEALKSTVSKLFGKIKPHTLVESKP